MNKIVKTEDPFVVRAREIINKPYARRLVPENEGGYSANIQEFPGCFAEGDSAEEALQNLDDAATSWIAVHISNGNTIREPIAFHGTSGKIALRIPRGLHQQVVELAEMEDCSINQLLTAAIAEYVGRTSSMNKFSEVLRHSLQAFTNFTVINTEKWILDKSLSGEKVKVIPTKETRSNFGEATMYSTEMSTNRIVHG